MKETCIHTPSGQIREQFTKIMLSNGSDEPHTLLKGALLGYLTPAPVNAFVVNVNKIAELLSVHQKESDSPFPPERMFFPVNNTNGKISKPIVEFADINRNLTPDQRRAIMNVIEQHERDFATDPANPGLTTTTQCDVPLRPGTKPIVCSPYRLSPNMAKHVKDQVDSLLQNKLITPIRSEWAFPVVMVVKPDGSFRFCVDYSRLNQHIIKDKFPLPRVDDTLDKLSKAKYFSKLDMASGFWQIPVKPEDRNTLAFNTTFGTYTWNVMPFGLCNAPAIFQAAMNETLHDHLFSIALVYLDDV